MMLFSCTEPRKNRLIIIFYSLLTGLANSFAQLALKTKLFCSAHRTHSPELNASTHFELHGAAHDVDALIPADDGLAVSFDVQVRRCAAGDLKERTVQKVHF